MWQDLGCLCWTSHCYNEKCSNQYLRHFKCLFISTHIFQHLSGVAFQHTSTMFCHVMKDVNILPLVTSLTVWHASSCWSSDKGDVLFYWIIPYCRNLLRCICVCVILWVCVLCICAKWKQVNNPYRFFIMMYQQVDGILCRGYDQWGWQG